MKGIGVLVKEDYYKPGYKVSEKDKILILEFLANTESVSDRDLLFIKRITKLAKKILISDPDSLEKLLANVLPSNTDSFKILLLRGYRFTTEGINLIRSDRLKGMYEAINSLKMESHLLSYKGNFAEALFELTWDDAYLEEARACYKQSAQMSATIEPEHSAHQSGFAAKVTYRLFKKTGEKSLVEDAISDYGDFIGYFRGKPDLKKEESIRMAKRDVRFLERRLRT